MLPDHSLLLAVSSITTAANTHALTNHLNAYHLLCHALTESPNDPELTTLLRDTERTLRILVARARVPLATQAR